MTNNFKKAFEEIIGVEGGYVNDPADRGGETKFGISKRAYPNLDIKNLTLAGAMAIYFDDYWNHYRLGLDRFEYQIAFELFDTAVNCGVQIAATFMQKSLNILNRNQTNYPDLAIDGWLGNVSFQAYQKVDKINLLKCLNGYQFMWYESIVGNSPTQEKYMNGWLKRVG